VSEDIDALFVSHYVNVDRWHNDDDGPVPVPSVARARGTLEALDQDVWMKDEVDVLVQGRLYDFSRFLSWVKYGSTKEWQRYDPFTMTLLAGSYYLSFVKRHGYDLRVANVASRAHLAELRQRYNPRFILLSTTLMFDAMEMDAVPQAVRQLRSAFPEAMIVLGGLLLVSYEKNLEPDNFKGLLMHYGADAYVITPQGEMPLLEILGKKSRAELSESPPARTWVRTRQGMQPPPETFETPVPFEEGFIRWSELPQKDHLYHTVHTRTARSCAFSCAFCEYPVNQGPLTLMSPEVVDRELAELRKLGTVRSLIFTDDTFNVPLRRFKELLKVLAKYDFEWYSFFRPQYADKETAELMKAAHCKAVFAGLESVDDLVLKNMHKTATADAYRKGLDELKKHDIQVHANFIVGFPGETEESAAKITPFIHDTGIDFHTVCTWSFIPSTPIGKRREEFSLEGMGVDWKHATMTSEQAAIIARQVSEEQRASVHNAVRGECWTEFLLYANGFKVDEVKQAIGTFNSFLGRDVPEAEVTASPAYATLKATLDRHDMPAVPLA
jgi:anaerobic magnesium-protoporphyrin IX monomethyl ester cyclase